MKGCSLIIVSSTILIVLPRFAGVKSAEHLSSKQVTKEASGLPMKILLVLLIPVVRWVMYRPFLSVRMPLCNFSVVNTFGHHSMRGCSPIVLHSNLFNLSPKFAIVQTTDSVGFQGILLSKPLLLRKHTSFSNPCFLSHSETNLPQIRCSLLQQL